MYYVLFNSITLATRMKNHFKFSGVRVNMLHTPTEISKGGCSYSLVISKENISEVLSAAKNYNIAVKGIYEQKGNDFYEVSIDDLS